MKIVHICLCGPMTDGWNYQENLLTKFHVRQGNDVTVITSKYCYNSDGKLSMVSAGTYIYNQIKMIRIDNRNGDIDSILKKYVDFTGILKEESPDIIFMHGLQFLDVNQVVDYVKTAKVKLYVDNHADFSNSGTNWVSLNIVHKIIWRWMAKKISPYVETFYGVLPARVDFLTDVYDIEPNKCKLLIMGADDDRVCDTNREDVIASFRKEYGITNKDFLIVTGGKIDSFKRQTILLMQAVKKIRNSNVKLIVFGSIEDKIKQEVMDLVDGEKIQYAGWIDADDSYRFFAASQLVVFPGRHSVFWEQVAGQGIPLLVKYWDGTTHIDCGKNIRFLHEDSANEIYNAILEILDGDNYTEMLYASKNASKNFLYSRIAENSIK